MRLRYYKYTSSWIIIISFLCVSVLWRVKLLYDRPQIAPMKNHDYKTWKHLNTYRNKTYPLNNVTEDELLAIPGVGPVLVHHILAYREQQRFASKKDLLKVKGIGPKIFEKLAPYFDDFVKS